MIEKNGKMSLEELAVQFPDVSDMTLRRDLLELEKENKVIRVRGGAMSVLEVQKRSGEAYAQKSTINTDAKKVIAKKAVSLIDEGSSLFLDGGTTALYLAKELPDRPCHVFTNGIAVAEELAHKKQPEVVLVGGTLIKENLSTASPYTKVFCKTPILNWRSSPPPPSPSSRAFPACHRWSPSCSNSSSSAPRWCI